MQAQRLQGKDFRNLRPELELIAYSVSDNKNICGYYVKPGTKKVIIHWMNDQEKTNFMQVYTELNIPQVTDCNKIYNKNLW